MKMIRTGVLLAVLACLALPPFAGAQRAPHPEPHEYAREHLEEAMRQREPAADGLRFEEIPPAVLDAIRTQAENKYGIKRESVSGSSKAQLRFYSSLDTPLPGKQMELATLLDQHHFARELNDIDAVWQKRTRERSLQLPASAELLDDWFALHPGVTMMVVGHMVDRDLVLTDAHGNESSRLPLASVKTAAERHGSVVVPISCKSANADAALGFTQNINAGKVASFLAALDLQPTLGALVKGMQTIGDMKINAEDAAAVVLTAATADDRSGKDESELEVRVDLPPPVVTRPAATPSVSSQAATGSGGKRYATLQHVTLYSIFLTFALMASEEFFYKLPRSRFLLASRSRSRYIGMVHRISNAAELVRKGMLALTALLILAVVITYNQ